MASERSQSKILTLVVVVASLLVLTYFLRRILLPFVVAGGAAYVLNPAVCWIEARLRLRHGLAAMLIYFLVLGLFALSVWRLNQLLKLDVSHAAGNPEQMLQIILRRLFHGEQIVVFGYNFSAADAAHQIVHVLQQFVATPADIAKLAALSIGTVFGVILTFVLLFYFLLSGPELARGALELAPPEHRPRLRSLATQVHPVLLRYVRGLFLIVLYTILAAWVGTGLAFHLPNAILLSIATGLLELAPVIGPISSAALLGSAAILHGGDVWTFVGFAVFCLALRLSIDQLVGPLLLGRAVRLHPVVVIFAFLAGGTLYGILGVLLATPAAATAKILLRAYYDERTGLPKGSNDAGRTRKPGDGD